VGVRIDRARFDAVPKIIVIHRRDKTARALDSVDTLRGGIWNGARHLIVLVQVGVRCETRGIQRKAETIYCFFCEGKERKGV
jgi:hypothetical protein